MKYGRTFNFSAGPAMMPEPVLEEIRDEMMNYRGSGMCVMEMSHRSKVFQQIAADAEADLRKLMSIPDNYKVLFIQGGGTVQFAMVAMNLMKNGKAVYIETGAWSKKAIAEASSFVESVELFDVYEGLQVGPEKKSMAFTVTFAPKEEEFTTEAVDGYVKKILKNLNNKLGVELRS